MSNERLEELEKMVAELRDQSIQQSRTLSVLTRVVNASEQTFMERTLETLYHSIHGMADLIAAQLNEIRARKDILGQHGQVVFEVHIVDGEKVRENGQSIMITKKDDALFLSAPANPDQPITDRGAHLINWFNQRPHLFKDRDRIVFNYLEHSHVDKPTPVASA